MADPDAVALKPKPAIDGDTAAAILLMLLGEDEAAAILRALDAGEVKKLGSAMMGVANATEAQIESALDGFVARSRSTAAIGVGVEPRVRTVMTQALGASRADHVLSGIVPRDGGKALDALRWMEPGQIATLLGEEHPQVGALILVHLSPEAAAEALSLVDAARQDELLLRAARLGTVSTEAIADLEAVLADAPQGGSDGPAVRMGGASETAKIVSNMRKPDEQRALKALKKKDKLLGQEIEDEMLIFDNLLELDTKGMGALLRGVDAAALTLALRGASEELREKMLGAMSARAAQSIRDDMAEAPPAKRADVEAAQKAVVGTARRMADAGELMIGGGGDDYV